MRNALLPLLAVVVLGAFFLLSRREDASREGPGLISRGETVLSSRRSKEVEDLRLPSTPEATPSPPVAVGALDENNEAEAAPTAAVDFCTAASAQEIWYRVFPGLGDAHTTERRHYFQGADGRMLILRQSLAGDGTVTLGTARWDTGGREVGNQEFNERQSARGFLDPEQALAAAGPSAEGLSSPQPTLREERIEWSGGNALLHNDIAIELEMRWTPPGSPRARTLRCPREGECSCLDP
jgi:hypothetical protein